MDSNELIRYSYATVTEEGLGQGLSEVNFFQLENLLQATFVIEICWGLVIWIVKYFILAFYWRLFSANGRSTRFIIWTLVALVTCWGTSLVRFCLLMLKVFADFLRSSRCFSPFFSVLLSIHIGASITTRESVILAPVSSLSAHRHHMLSLMQCFSAFRFHLFGTFICTGHGRSC